ncbi:unnamed protein product [Prunus armeniaca]
MTVLITEDPGRSIDVHLRPLVDELKDLWTNGVRTYNKSTRKMFTLQAAVMWTVNDFPVYAMVSGWSTKGYMACPVCKEDVTSGWQAGKVFYLGHWRWLPWDHEWRENDKEFNRNIEVTSDLENGSFGKTVSRTKPSTHLNWTHKSMFFEVPYWSKLKLRHNLDVMHVEKNVFDTLMGTILDIEGKTKDTIKARLDLERMGIRRDFLKFVSFVKFLDGYASNIVRCENVDGGKFARLKSHDCHVFMQCLLPVGIQHLLSKDVVKLIMLLSRFLYKYDPRDGSFARRGIACWSCQLSLDVSKRKAARRVEKNYVDIAFNRPQRNNDGGVRNEKLSVFAQRARPFGDPVQEELFSRNDMEVNKLKSSNSPIYSEELYNLAFSQIRAELFSGCHVNGIKFLGTARDDKLCTQNSGVHVPGGGESTDIDFYDKLTTVLQLLYKDRYQVIMFKCRWFDTNPNRQGSVKIDHGLLSMNINRTWYDDDPYILANMAKQIVYLDDPKARSMGPNYESDEEEDWETESDDSDDNETTQTLNRNEVLRVFNGVAVFVALYLLGYDFIHVQPVVVSKRSSSEDLRGFKMEKVTILRHGESLDSKTKGNNGAEAGADRGSEVSGGGKDRHVRWIGVRVVVEAQCAPAAVVFEEEVGIEGRRR